MFKGEDLSGLAQSANVFRSRKRISAPPPFSGMNSIPASSSIVITALTLFAISDAGPPLASILLRVGTEIDAARSARDRLPLHLMVLLSCFMIRDQWASIDSERHRCDPLTALDVFSLFHCP